MKLDLSSPCIGGISKLTNEEENPYASFPREDKCVRRPEKVETGQVSFLSMMLVLWRLTPGPSQAETCTQEFFHHVITKQKLQKTQS